VAPSSRRRNHHGTRSPQPRVTSTLFARAGGHDRRRRRAGPTGPAQPPPYLRRHLHGDWGDLSDSDRRQNDAALKSGEDRLFSSYQVTRDLKLWIITEWDRSVTTLLLPSEY
jgi:hypothetical protein